MDVSGQDIGVLPALAIVDGRGRVTSWSSGAQALLGYAPDEIVGEPVTELVASRESLRHHDGHEVRGHLRVAPLDEAGPQGGMLLTIVAEADADTCPDDLVMRWMFDQQPAFLAIYDVEARVLRGNASSRRVTGMTEGEARGHRLAEIMHGRVFDDIQRRIARVAETGEPQTLEPFVKLPGEERPHAWAVDLFPLRDAAGHVRAVGLCATDYSQQYGSRERLALLNEARTRIGASLDMTEIARGLVELAVPAFADVAAVELLEPVFRGGAPHAPTDSFRPPVLRRAAHRSADHRSERLEAGGEADPGGRGASPIVQCLIEDRVIQRATGSVSCIALPLRTGEKILGAALFERTTDSREAFDPDDVTVIGELVARAAVCIDNARRYSRERRVSLTLQRAMLPKGEMSVPSAEVAARYLPTGDGSEAGGDWFDVIPLPGARLGLVVGDVVGHGITASATMGRLRTAVRTLADIDLPPDELLTHLDDIVSHTADEEDDDAAIPGEIGATVLYAVYDPVSGTCSAARAGHLPPVVVGPDGGRLVDLPDGPPLGLGSLPFESAEFAVPEGETLALFTDGLVVSRERDVDAGVAKLLDALRRSATSLDELCDRVLASLRPKQQVDDVTLLLVRPHRLGNDEVAEWSVPADPAAVAQMRRNVARTLEGWDLEEAVILAELVVSELVTNAIRYGSDPIKLRVIRDRNLVYEVADGSSTSPHLRRSRLSDEGGRGLFLVAELTRRWGTRYTRSGKIIWAEQQLDGQG